MSSVGLPRHAFASAMLSGGMHNLAAEEALERAKFDAARRGYGRLHLYPHPALAYQCATIKTKADIPLGLIEGMKDCLAKGLFSREPGVGLAANQVGAQVRACLIKFNAKEQQLFADRRHGRIEMNDVDFRNALAATQHLPQTVQVMINPVIIDHDTHAEYRKEGCLSIPGFVTSVKRRPFLRVKFVDEHWQGYQLELEGVAAQAVQHELDHMDGKCVADYATSRQQRRSIERMMDEARRHPSAFHCVHAPVEPR